MVEHSLNIFIAIIHEALAPAQSIASLKSVMAIFQIKSAKIYQNSQIGSESNVLVVW